MVEAPEYLRKNRRERMYTYYYFFFSLPSDYDEYHSFLTLRLDLK